MSYSPPPLPNGHGHKIPLLQLNEEEIKLIRQSWEMGTNSNTSFEKPKKKGSIQKFKSTYTSTISTSVDGSSSAMFGLTSLWIMVYEDLIHLNPHISHFMPTIKHMTVQYSSILMMAVENLEDLRSTQAVLRRLGRTHARVFNVEHDHFRLLGESISRVLERSEFDIRIIDLWMQIYGFLANTMIQAAKDLVTFDEERSRSMYTVFVDAEDLCADGNTTGEVNDDSIENPSNLFNEMPNPDRSKPRSVKRSSVNTSTLRRYKTLSSSASTIVEENRENQASDCQSLNGEEILYENEPGFRDSSNTLVAGYRDTITNVATKRINNNFVTQSVIGKKSEKTLGMRIFGKFTSSSRAVSQ